MFISINIVVGQLLACAPALACFMPSACSLGRIWLISHVLSANEQYFSLTPNQPIVLQPWLISQTSPNEQGDDFAILGQPNAWHRVEFVCHTCFVSIVGAAVQWSVSDAPACSVLYLPIRR